MPFSFGLRIAGLHRGLRCATGRCLQWRGQRLTSHGLPEPEEPGAGPVSARDRPSDLGQRGIMATVVLEGVLSHGDRVGAPAPFAHEPGARLDLRADLAPGFERRGEARELAL